MVEANNGFSPRSTAKKKETGVQNRAAVEKQETVQDKMMWKVSTKSVNWGYKRRVHQIQSYSCQLCAFSTTVRVGELGFRHVIDLLLL